jgi:hypothetical protein
MGGLWESADLAVRLCQVWLGAQSFCLLMFARGSCIRVQVFGSPSFILCPLRHD